nr:type IX secretion system outer membrane channel protein PorV [Bacteroidales bacterium]
MRFNPKFFVLTALAGLVLNVTPLKAQTDRQMTITTAVPFLLIAPDARGGSMGETGVASDPDVNSMHWNPAKFAFLDKGFGLAASYTPWLSDVVDDIGLGYVAGYYKIDKMQAVSASLRYFSLGEITFTDASNVSLGTYKPNEFNISLAYSRMLTRKLSAGLAAKFIYSNLTQRQSVGTTSTKAGVSVAVDASIYYKTELRMRSVRDAWFAFGVNISNIGSKISYTDTGDKDFIPTQLRFGPAFSFDLDRYNSFSINADITKLLVPTPPVRSGDTVIDGKDDNVGIIQGMFQSFYDAPDGFSEELKEFTWAIGAEYWYNKQFAVRSGYHHESQDKGNRQFVTFGAGLRYNVFGLDFSYLVSLTNKSPLDNTLRFTLLFDFDA